MISIGMLSLYDLIQGECIVLNCIASYWSVCVYHGESHDWLLFCLILIGQFRSHDLIKLPLQFSPKLSPSVGISFLKTRVFFYIWDYIRCLPREMLVRILEQT